MTKKDYELFANEIYQNKDFWNETEIFRAVALCKCVFKKDNPLFQADKFERACYEGKHIRKAIKERG